MLAPFFVEHIEDIFVKAFFAVVFKTVAAAFTARIEFFGEGIFEAAFGFAEFAFGVGGFVAGFVAGGWLRLLLLRRGFFIRIPRRRGKETKLVYTETVPILP